MRGLRLFIKIAHIQSNMGKRRVLICIQPSCGYTLWKGSSCSQRHIGLGKPQTPRLTVLAYLLDIRDVTRPLQSFQ